MILKKIKEAIRKYGLIKNSNKVIVGVSGGPDSVALLFLLNSLKKELNLSLHIAHLDHGLRPDSGSDAKFVIELAKRLKLPVTCGKVNIKMFTSRGSLEETARNIRFAFLFAIAKRIKADKVALAHNADDQAETVLMRLLRGSGLYGLSGIAPKRNISGFEIIRPLINIKRKEIESYLRRKRITPRLDKTNLEDVYFRNKIRNKLLPELEHRYNKNIREALNNIAETASLDYDYILACAKQAEKRLGRRINLKKFIRLHPALQRIIIRLNIAKVKGDTRTINFQHIREIESLILKRPSGSIVDLPKGVSVIKKGKILLFYRR